MSHAGVISVIGFLAVCCLALPALNAQQAVDGAEQDLKGFDRRTVDAEKARRAMALGLRFFHDKAYDMARREFAAAYELDRGLIEARYRLGVLEKTVGRYNLAVEHLEVVYRTQPSRDSLGLMLAESWLGLAECEKAAHWLEVQSGNKKDRVNLGPLKRKIRECRERGRR